MTVRSKKVRPASVAAKRVLGLGRGFLNRHISLSEGRTRHDVFRGFIFRTANRKRALTTTIMDLPVEVRGYAADVRSPGRSVDVGPPISATFDREQLFPEPSGTFAPRDTAPTELDPTVFVLGAPMPDTAVSLAYYSGQSQPPTRGAPVSASATFRASELFSMIRPPGEPLEQLVPPGVGLWLDIDLWFTGKRSTKITLSEAWVQGLAPGYRLLSDAHELTVPSPLTKVLSDGVTTVLSVVLRKQRGAYDDTDTTGNRRDRGYTALLTFALTKDPNDPSQLVVAWSHLWSLEQEADGRLVPAPYPTGQYGETPPDGYGGITGIGPNEILPDLVLLPSGEVRGVCIVFNSRSAITDEGATRGCFSSLALVEVQWVQGVFNRRIFASQMFMSKVTYTRLLVNAEGRPHVPDVVAFADLFGVGDADKTQDVAPLYTTTVADVFSPTPSHLLLAVVVKLTGFNPDHEYADGDGYYPLTAGLSDVAPYVVYSENRGVHYVYDPYTELVASWSEADVGVAPANASTVPRLLAGRSSLTSNYPASIPVGVRAFMSVEVDVANAVWVTALFTPDEAVTFAQTTVPLFTTPTNGVGWITLQCYQRRLVSESGEFTVPAGICLATPEAVHVSGDSAVTWQQVTASRINHARVMGTPLWWDIPPTRVLEL